MSGGCDLERIRGRLRAVRIERMFRLIHRRRRRRPLGVVPTPSRFSDTAGAYAVLYAAEAARCAFWEALARNRFTRRNRRELPRADVEARLVVSFRSGRLDKSNSHLFSKPLLSKDRLSGVNSCHNYQMLSKTDAI